MRSTTFLALFLLAAFISYLPSSTAQALLDVEGKAVRNGGTYYLVPQLRPHGGGIEVAKIGKEGCPLTVVKSLDENSNGEPIMIASPLRSAFIPEYSLLKIGFSDPPKCAPSPWWTVVKDQSERRPTIKLSEYKRSELDYPFQFERVYTASKMYAYKLLYCGSEDEEEEIICKDIGIFRDQEGYQRLIVSRKNPLWLGLRKLNHQLHEALMTLLNVRVRQINVLVILNLSHKLIK